ncbi:carbohydrate ABC transporter permease [Devosia sp.]|uniref:carbohydrate ABC transporter permease n=1 Tax=Devosia sp. TaxID=1871048 RepID=UPI003267FC88
MTLLQAANAPVAVAVADQGRIAGEKRSIGYLIGAICLFVVALMISPLVLSFLASIKTKADAAQVPPGYLPQQLSANGYIQVYNFQAGLPSYVWNSLFTATLTIVFCLVLAVPAGYGLARFKIPFKELWFLLLLATMMIPFQALLVPLYLMFAKIGLANNHFGLAIVHTVIQLPFSVYLMRNAFEGVPRELEEAAVIDGCNSFTVLRRIFLPLVVPGMVTVALFAFITSWNEFIAALIFMNKETTFTVPIMLVSVRTGRLGAVDWSTLQAGVLLSILPCVLIYLLLQRYYVSGFLSGAVK